MRRPLIITDLTRMSGTRVCIAGLLPDRSCVRPVFAHGDVTEPWLYRGLLAVVRPFAIVELDLEWAKPKAPHTEDWIVSRRHRTSRGALSSTERHDLLEAMSSGSVVEAFDTPLLQQPGWYVLEGSGGRSLGTIRTSRVMQVSYDRRQNASDRWEFRIAFADETDTRYSLPVTDLAFQYYLGWLRLHDGRAPAHAARQVLAQLREAEAVYLRVGLTRGTWSVHPGKCFLQVTGIYTFPDYLNGGCFADFAPDDARPGRELDLSDVPF